MFKTIMTLSLLSVSLIVHGAGDKVKAYNGALKISVLSSNKVLLNGEEVSPTELMQALIAAKSKNAEVWYYRENAQAKAPPAGTQVIKMVIDNKLAISFSAKSDFSDVVDENGVSKPR